MVTRPQHRIMALALLLASVLVSLAIRSGHAQEADPGTPADSTGHLIGHVKDPATGEPVPSVRISIPALGRTTLTDEGGHFDLASLPAGTHTLQIRHIRYGRQSAQVTVLAGETVGAELAFRPRAIEVAPLEVSVRRLNPDLVGTGFYRRKLADRGGFFGDEEYLNAPVRSYLPIEEAVEDMGPSVLRLGMGPERKCAPILVDGVPYDTNYVNDYAREMAGIEIYAPGEAPPNLFRQVKMFRNLHGRRVRTGIGQGQVVEQPRVERCGLILVWRDRDGRRFGR